MWQMGVPVATPIMGRDVAAGIAGVLKPDDRVSAFERRIFALCGTSPAGLLNSGRAALFATLLAMKEACPRDEVVIPAFVCPSVGRAVVKAGLRVVLCDVTPSGFGLDIDALERAITARTLAVVTTHLFGYPTDVAPVLRLAHAAGAMVIEDAAQAFGATRSSRYVGTTADAGIFSFGLSKVIFTMGGGLIFANSPRVAERLGSVLAPLRASPAWLQAAGVLELACIAMLVRSHHLGPLARFWAGALRGKHDADDFEISACTPAQAAVGCSLLRRLAEITAARERNARCFLVNLSGILGIRLPERDPDSEPVCLRFPIVVEDPAKRALALARLQRSGINASQMYDRTSYEALCRFASGRPACPQTEYLIDRMLNLPTHPYMREQDMKGIVAVFHEVFGS